MTAQDHQETPTTAAGRRLLANFGNRAQRPRWIGLILAIEAEAAARQVPSYEDIATALNMYENEAQFDPWPPDEMLGKHHVGCMHVGRVHDHLSALLSAGDKAKAPTFDKVSALFDTMEPHR